MTSDTSVRPPTSERLIAEALRSFSERGFESTTLEEIARASGITGPAIYRHFASKQDILAVIFDRAGRLFMASVREAANLAPLEALECLVDRLLDLTLADEGYVTLWIRERRHLSDSYVAQAETQQRAYDEEWVRALSRYRPDLTYDESLAIVACAIGVIVTPFILSMRLPAERVRQTLRSSAMLLLTTGTAGAPAP